MLEFMMRKAMRHLFNEMVQPVFREAVRYSSKPSTKVCCDVCRGPFPSHVHVCDECSVRVLKPVFLRRLVRVFGRQVYIAVVNAEMVE